ncbi:P-loop NTPase [Roseivivax sp. GX 12232]|uniref:CpsD/CapB family tyrosine-protein kinase n=1 Tax=Roseivivax sp. GX 12232 TaxID=2900547 RepID=UPI001E559DAF|nr:CpsD/CapB family tyrosine-protein kinase [Roseivivax sp. GX 12232]MCE0505421.1 P-loop NTPase [Roseivivax sp. GX 12232]
MTRDRNIRQQKSAAPQEAPEETREAEGRESEAPQPRRRTFRRRNSPARQSPEESAPVTPRRVAPPSARAEEAEDLTAPAGECTERDEMRDGADTWVSDDDAVAQGAPEANDQPVHGSEPAPVDSETTPATEPAPIDPPRAAPAAHPTEAHHDTPPVDTPPADAPSAAKTAAPSRPDLGERDSAAADRLWARLQPFALDERMLDRNRIITASRYDPAYSSFDVLRTRLLQALSERGWTRVAITSPTQGCGKTFTAANLAISLARQENCRTILFDTDLRNPSLGKVFGLRGTGVIGNMFRGQVTPADHLRRVGPNAIHAGHNLAVGFNEAPETYASELLQDPRTARTLATIEENYDPDVMLFDMPPALYGDDVIAMRPCLDAVILVVGGGLTTEREIREVERRLGTETPLLGVVMNRAEGSSARKYSY